MYYTYMLQSKKDSRLCIGSTNDLRRRLQEHNMGQSTYTKSYIPWKLVYYDAYLTLSLARNREKQLKRFAKSFVMLKKRLAL